MYVTDFAELAEVMMKRKRIQLKDIAEFIGTSSVYARQVIDGYQRGEKADFLGIDRKYANVNQPA